MVIMATFTIFSLPGWTIENFFVY